MDEKPTQKTYVAFVIDISKSMINDPKVWEQAVEGFNEHLSKWKKAEEEGQEVYVSVVLFNGKTSVCKWLVRASDIFEAQPTDITPVGSTAMYDAIGFTINELTKTTDQNENSAWCVTIISDGKSNDDKVYKPHNGGWSRIGQLRAEKEKTGKWTFTSMLHDAKYAGEVAAVTGIAPANIAVWDAKDGGKAKAALMASAERIEKYTRDRSAGKLSTMNFMSDTSGEAMDYSSVEMCGDKADIATFKRISIPFDPESFCPRGPGGSSPKVDFTDPTYTVSTEAYTKGNGLFGGARVVTVNEP